MDDIVFRTVLLRGAQGAQGEPGTADAIPTGGVISLDGSSVPEGFEETTIDTVPTKNSNNVVESGGIYDSEKDIYAVMGEMGAKNLIPYPYYETTKEVNGVTFTNNGDGTITLNGTSTAETSFWVHSSYDMMSLSAGAYIVEQPIDYNEKRLFFRVYERSSGTNVRIVDYNTEGRTTDTFTLAQDMPNLILMALITRSGQTYNNFIVKPMIRLASDTNPTWKPYAKTNKQLTDEIATKADVSTVAEKAEKTAMASGESLALVPTSEGKALIHTVYGMSVQNGTPTPSVPVDIESAKADFRCVGKNLLPCPYYRTSGYTSNGMTTTYDSDGVMTINKVAGTATAFFNLAGGATYFLKANTKYRLWFELENTNQLTIYVSIGGTDVAKIAEKSSGKYHAEFTMPQILTGNMSVGIYAYRGNTETNAIVKVMITPASVTDDTYEPYTKTDLTTNITLRAIEVSSTDDYNLVRDNKYYIADTLDYSEDNGFVLTRRIGHDVIDGSTLPVVYSGVDRQKQVFYINETRVMPRKDTNPVISDRFQKVSGLPPLDANGYIRNTGSNSLRIYIYTADYTTADAFNAFFAQNNTNVDFILAEPTTESITTEQALALLSLKTYDESTSISSQAEPSCTVAIEYAKERLGALALIAHNLAKGNDLRIAELEETP